MSNLYNVTKAIVFTELSSDNFYWTLTVTINSSVNVSNKPFLLESFVDSNVDIAEYSGEQRFIRTLLNSEIGKYPPKADITTTAIARWVTYRTNTFTNKFYTYKALQSALQSIETVLKANTGSYSPEDIKPFKAAIKNITYSSLGKDSSDRTKLYEGDTLAISFSGGSGEVSITCAGVSLINLQPSNHLKANSRLYRVPLVNVATFSNIVVTDSNANSVVTFPISILKPANYGSTTEDIL